MATVDEVIAMRRNGSPVATLITEAGVPYSLLFTPEGGTVSGENWVVEQTDRPGREPIVRADRRQAKTLSWKHTIVDVPGATADETVNRLRDLAATGQRVRAANLSYAETVGWWLISDLSVEITARRTDQAIKEAELSWTLLQAENPPAPVSATPPPTAAAPVSAASPRTHTVVRGDTLWAIASRYLGNPQRYPEIASLNGVKNPNLIYPGTVFRIPAR